jgi:hypothetical protein
MAADANRLAAALAYEDDRRRRLAESIPALTGPTTALRRNVRTDLENLSAGLGQGIVNQLEGVKGLITDPVGTAKGAYEAVRGIARDPKVLAQALAETGRKAMSGPLGAGEVVGEMLGPMRGKPPMAEIDVYHGSPHRFEEFDASKIGTGEGQQAYGHGIYVAEQKDVADMYRRALTPHQVSDNDAQSLASYAMRQRHNKDDAIKWLQKEKTAYKSEQSPETLAQYDAAINVLQGGNVPKVGNFYTADLPDEMVDRMLDWDKPLSEQRELATPILKELGYLRPNDDGPRQFAQAVKALDMEYGGFGESGANGMALFKAIYRGLEQGKPKVIDFAKRMNLGDQAMFMEASPLASEVMKRMGIPGIRYLDAGSRGQGGSGTRNFVVFPGEEKKVKILKRE